MKHSHYFRDVSHLTKIDSYRIIDLFNVTDPCLQHILKKVLCPGGRGHKDVEHDIQDIYDTIKRRIEMNEEDAQLNAPAQSHVYLDGAMDDAQARAALIEAQADPS